MIESDLPVLDYHTSDHSVDMSDSFSVNTDSQSVNTQNYASVDDDLSTSFSTLYDDDTSTHVSTPSDSPYDDKRLEDLISQLKGTSKAETMEDPTDETDCTLTQVSDDENDNAMTDNAIDKVLAAISKTTTKKKPKRSLFLPSDDSYVSSENMSASEAEEDESLMHLEENDDLEDDYDPAFDSDEESIVEEIYAKADKLIEKFGLPANPDPAASGKEMLESLLLRDYNRAPSTQHAQTKWVTKLAQDLIQEVSSSSSDSEDDSLDTDDIQHCDSNVQELANHTDLAQQLIETHARAAETLQRQQQAAITNPAPTARPRRFQKKVKSYLPDPEHFKKLSEQARQQPAEVSDDVSVLHRELPMDSINDLMDRYMSEPDSDLISISGGSETPVMIAVPKPKRNKPTKERRQFSHLMQSATEQLSQLKQVKLKEKPSKQEQSKDTQNIVIPSGFPPYPGFGPKWPWHPNSPRAPSGYRECYMHHMGDYYYQYMEYLRTRASQSDDDTTQAEELMRSSLSSQAKFKSYNAHKSNEAAKPTPALSPYTFASKPGKARKNCKVPTLLPKIEEGSFHSSVSSVPPVLEKKIQQKQSEQPDDIQLGKHHKKSKGRKGKIVVVSGKELEEKAKQEKKFKKKVGYSILEQPQAGAVTEQGCACVIM